MKLFLYAVVALCIFVPEAICSTNSVAWCYHNETCNDLTWPKIATKFCNGTRQSPINIVSTNATENANLTAFTFYNFSSTSVMEKIENVDQTVKVKLKSGVGISGGDLPEAYDSLQFHLHWGNGSSIPGSEHTVDGKRYPMELHIVNSKSSLNKNTTLAVEDPDGLAALGFFIDVLPGNVTGQPASWKNLTSYLSAIVASGSGKNITDAISLNDLLTGVDFTKYYRYRGSLTTPLCNEAVVWTVFKDPIQISKDLIDLFSQTVRIGDNSSALLLNVYRRIQPAQPVTTQPKQTSSGSTVSVSYLLCLIVLIFTL